MTRRTLALGGAFAIAARAQDLHFSKRNPRDRFVGPWTLMSYQKVGAPGAPPSNPLGPDAIGHLAYDPLGRMSVQIMRRSRPAFASGDQWHGTPDEIRAGFEGYIAYLGFYEVHEAEHIVQHQLEMSLFPNWTGTIQKRYYEFQDEHLIWRENPAGQPGIVITWQRAI